jgi:hypothetical protein
MAAKWKAIVAHITHTSSALMQQLDSKDKIATRLQPATRAIILLGLSAQRRLSGEARAARRTAQCLGSKGLAIMNFL